MSENSDAIEMCIRDRLRTVRWVLTNVMQIGFIAAIVLFQPELRRTVEHMRCV